MSLSADQITQAAIEFAVPLWLAGLGELVVQRAGVINIGIEGLMLAGAFAGWAIALTTGSAWLGLMAAAIAGMLLAGVFALVAVRFGADQIVTGTAINLLAVGATGMGFKIAVESELSDRTAAFFRPISFDALPFEALNQYGLCYTTILLALMLHYCLGRTRPGIELQSLGEYPAAADAMGIQVNRRRVVAVLFGGLTAGLAGSYLSLMFVRDFNENLVSGRGFLALAMVIFGRWRPMGLVLAGLFFGSVYAVETYLEVSSLPGMPAPQILQMSPYLLTIVALAGWAGRSRSPAALGQPFNRH